MANPIVFPSTTPNFSLPLLFVGQAQKEPFINQAISIVDSLLKSTVEDSLATPPTSPLAGQMFRVLGGATGEWAGHDGELALQIGGAWQFIPPHVGMTVFDKTALTQLRYNSDWETAVEPSEPVGGTTVDNEARAAISELISALRSAGLFTNLT